MSNFSLGTAQLDTAVSLTGLEGGLNQAKGIAADKVKSLSATLGETLTFAIAGGLSAIGGALIWAGKETFSLVGQLNQAQKLLQAQLGLTTEAAAATAETVKQVWANGFGGSIEDVREQLTAVHRNMQRFGEVSQEQLQRTTEDAFRLRDAFGLDAAETTNAASAIVSMGASWDEAMDIIAAGNQRGLNTSGDYLESLSEYAPYFKQAGFSAAQMFSILESGAMAGVQGVDKIGDLVKEFGIRLTDGSKASRDAFAALGVNYDVLAAQLNSGELSGAQVFDTTIAKLKSMDDQVLANQLGVSLFGTQWEDMTADVIYGINAQATAMEDITGATDSLDVQYDNLGAAVEGIKRRFISSLEPVASRLLNITNMVMPEINAVIADFSDELAWMGQVGEDAVTTLKQAMAGEWVDNAKVIMPIHRLAGALGLLLSGDHASAVQSFKNLFGQLVEAAQGSLPLLGDALEGVLPIVEQALKDGLPVLGNTLKSAFKTVMPLVGQALKDGLPVLNESLRTAFKTAMPVVGDALKEGLPVLGNAVLDLLIGVGNLIVQYGPQALPALVEGLEGVINQGLSMLGSGGLSVDFGWLTNLFTDLKPHLDVAWGIIEPLVSQIVLIFSNLKTSAQTNGAPFMDALGKIGDMVMKVAPLIGGVLVFAFGIITSQMAATAAAIGPIVTGILGILGGLATAIGGVADIITGAIMAVVGVINGDGAMVEAGLQKIKDGAVAVWEGLKSATIAAFTGLMDGALAIVGGFGEGVINYFGGLYESLTGEKMPAIVTDVLSQFRRMKENGLQYIADLWHEAEAALDNAKATLVRGAESVGKGIADGIKGGAQSAVNYVKGILNQIIDTFNTAINAFNGLGGPQMATIPKLAQGTGGAFWGGGWAEVGEFGRELMYIPQGAEVFSAARSDAMPQRGGSETPVIGELHQHIYNDLDKQALFYEFLALMEERR